MFVLGIDYDLLEILGDVWKESLDALLVTCDWRFWEVQLTNSLRFPLAWIFVHSSGVIEANEYYLLSRPSSATRLCIQSRIVVTVVCAI